MNDYQIVIPMSGFGERFRRAGYKVPKPLIHVDGKPIIAHVIDLFPGELDFVFICNEDHLNDPSLELRSTLEKYCPTGKVVSIRAHKQGPVYAVLQAQDYINFDKKIVINYCDFSCYWEWDKFKEFVELENCAGAIPAYKGFHPHSLGTTNYAYLLEEEGRVIDIQEKQPYTDNRMNEYASSGTYYFQSGQLAIEALKYCIEKNLIVGNEFYISLAFKYLFNHGLNTYVYPINYFMQWGTPEDLVEYQSWSDIFQELSVGEIKIEPLGTVIIPMAGLGKRFEAEGYLLTKPLIPVTNLPMVLQAVKCLPPARNHIFILRNDMEGYKDIQSSIRDAHPNATICELDKVTDGQACTTLLGVQSFLQNNLEANQPITIGACDNGMLYQSAKLSSLINDPDVDVIVWASRGHINAIRNPSMFGWIDVDSEGYVQNVSVKKALDDPAQDPIIIGTFTFKNIFTLKECIDRLVSRDGRVNGELYLDSCINDAIALGLRCKIFEVDHFISWGTPNDLKTFEYWQNCFNIWPNHPYSILKDRLRPI